MMRFNVGHCDHPGLMTIIARAIEASLKNI